MAPWADVALDVVLQPVTADGIDWKGHVHQRPAGLGLLGPAGRIGGAAGGRGARNPSRRSQLRHRGRCSPCYRLAGAPFVPVGIGTMTIPSPELTPAGAFGAPAVFFLADSSPRRAARAVQRRLAGLGYELRDVPRCARWAGGRRQRRRNWRARRLIASAAALARPAPQHRILSAAAAALASPSWRGTRCRA
jgi:hypothetical protein